MDWSIIVRAISYPFTISPTGKVVATSDISKIYQDRALTLVSSLVNQRFMRPGYGVDFGRGLYENMNSYVDGLDSALRSALATWLPELTVIDLEILNLNNDGVVEVNLNLSLPNDTNVSLSYKTTIISADGTATPQGRY